MAVTHEELVLLQAQMEGLESIFFELYPFGVELKRQQVQDYYNQRFAAATQAQISVARGELKRNFNTRANQVRNLVDSAESIGEVSNKLHLIIAAGCLPHERTKPFDPKVINFCEALIFENKIDSAFLDKLLVNMPVTAAEARILLACAMFCGQSEINTLDGRRMPVAELLAGLVTMAKTKDLLPRNDPFYTEALYFLEALCEDNPDFR